MQKAICYYCGSDEQKIYLTTKDWNWETPGIFNLVKCKICGLIFLSPAPEVDELKIYYPEKYYTRASGIVKITEEVTKNLEKGFDYRLKIIEHFKNSGMVLDIGYGDGHFLNFLRKRNWNV